MRCGLVEMTWSITRLIYSLLRELFFMIHINSARIDLEQKYYSAVMSYEIRTRYLKIIFSFLKYQAIAQTLVLMKRLGTLKAL